MRQIAIVVLAAAAVFLVLSGPTGAKEKAGPPAETPVLEVVGLSLALPDPDSKYGGSLVSSLSPGAQVYFRATMGGKTAIELIDADSELLAFTDETGAALAAPGSGAGFSSWLTQENVSEDGKTVTFAVRSEKDKFPARGTKALTVKGKIVILTGAEPKTETAKLALKVGEKIAAGPCRWTLSGLRDKGWGKAKMTVTFQSPDSFAAVRAVTFKDAAGKTVEHSDAGSSRLRMNETYTYTKSFGLHEKADAVTLEIEYYSLTEKLTLSFETTLGAGL